MRHRDVARQDLSLRHNMDRGYTKTDELRIIHAHFAPVAQLGEVKEKDPVNLFLPERQAMDGLAGINMDRIMLPGMVR